MNTAAPDDHTAFIRSTADPATGKPACLLEWGTVTALLTPDTVHTTARDLMTAATHAETDIALLGFFREDLDIDDDRACGHMLRHVRERRPRPSGTIGPALRIHAVAGARTGNPLVHIARGSMKGELTPDEARQMALHWTEAAVAAQIDARLRYVLGEHHLLSRRDIDDVFTKLQELQR